MVRQIKVLVCLLALCCALCTTTQAATHSVYDNGSMSNTYVTYFKDIVSGIGFNENYVAFRSGQYSYVMVVGQLDLDGNTVKLIDHGKIYEFSTDGTGYNSYYKYYVNDITNFSVDLSNDIIYTDLGDYPELIERGDKYEILSVLLLCIICLSCVVGRVFRHR